MAAATWPGASVVTRPETPATLATLAAHAASVATHRPAYTARRCHGERHAGAGSGPATPPISPGQAAVPDCAGRPVRGRRCRRAREAASGRKKDEMNDDTSGGGGLLGRWRRPAVAVLAAVAAAALVAACGGGSPAGAAAAGSTDYQKAVAYAQCMRSHGVPNFPDPDS